MGIIKPESEFQEKYLNSDARIMVAGGSMGCLPAEAEYLSKRGWKKISEYDQKEIGVVELDKADRFCTKLSFEKPNRYINLPCKTMRHLKAPRFGMKLSEEHRVVYWNVGEGSEAYQERSFSEILASHEKSKTKGWTGKIRTSFSRVEGTRGIPLDEGWLRLQVAVMADGHFVPEGADNYCIMMLSKKRKVKRFVALCEEYGIPYRDLGWKEEERYSSGGIHKFVVHPKMRQKTYKGVFWDATQEQLEIISDEAPHWDGSIKDRGKTVTKIFYSKSQEDADFMQYVFSSQGQTSTIVKDQREPEGQGYIVNTSPRGNGFRGFANKDGKCPVIEEPTTDGRKYCFETRTGFFLVRYEGRIFVTGNSSKTFVGLMRHARFIEDPNYIGYVIRKNSTMLTAAGGVFDEAVDLYKQIEPRIDVKTRDRKIIFPSGAQVAFNHYENSRAGENLYRGLQITNIMYDEASQAEERDIWFLLSRMRSKAAYDGSMWLTCNPDPDSYLFKWVQWYLYPEKDENGNPHPLAGRPDPEKNGTIRYMLRRGNDVAWGETPEELIEKYRVPGMPDPRPISFQGLFGTIFDNPPLIELNPDYLANLESLPRIEKERNLYGNWLARQEAAGYFKRQWVTEAHDEPPRSEIIRTVRAYDLAGELKSETNPDPDYIASVKMSKLRNGTYFIHNVQRFRARFGDWVTKIVETAHQDGRHVDILIPQDPNASAKAAARMLVNDIISHGFSAMCRPTNRSKIDRFRPFAAAAKNGSIVVLANCASDFENKVENDNSFYYKELEEFDGGRKGHDDMVDSTSDAFMDLAQAVHVPNFSLPTFSKPNEFKF